MFNQREAGSWDPADVVRFRAMLSTRLTAAFFSILPVGLYHAGVPKPSVWVVSNVLFACFFVQAMARLPSSLRSLPESSFSRPLARGMFLSQGLAVLLLVLSAIDILVPTGPAAFVYAIVLMLTQSGILFARLVSGWW